MKMKTLVLCGLMLAMVSAPLGTAQAEGVDLAWNSCLPNATAAQDKTDCGVVSFFLVASFDPPTGVSQLCSQESVIDLQSASPTLPAFWNFQTGGCQAVAGGSLVPSFTGTLGTRGACIRPWGSAVPGLAGLNFVPSGNRARIKLVASVATAECQPVSPGTNYFAYHILMEADPAACAGCTDPVCIVLNEIKLVQPTGLGDRPVVLPKTRNFVTWQGGQVPGAGCPGATPTQSRSWGQIKTLYR